jgi:hypothetical protein
MKGVSEETSFFIYIKKKHTMGFVYLIEDPSNLTYKIGVTRKNDKNRLKRLQTGNSTQLELVSIYETQYPFRMESILHNRFQHKRVLNEWYELDMDEVDKFPDICKEIDDIIILMKDNPFFGKNLK